MQRKSLSIVFRIFVLMGLLAGLMAVLPLPVLAASGDRYEVKGAGTAAVNGAYTWVTNEKYTFDNSGTLYYIIYCPSVHYWLITNAEDVCSTFTAYYYTMSASPTPPETGWQVMTGSAPAPTVMPAAQGATIEKTVSSRSVAPGELITYTLKVSNAYTDSITGIVVTDTLPVSITNTSVSSTGLSLTPRGGAPFAWDVADLTAGQTGTITITGQLSTNAATGIQINNTAEITASQGGGSSSAAFASDFWRLVGPEDFSPQNPYSYLSLALDSNDIPYVAFSDGSQSNKLTVMRYTSGAWQTVGAAGFSAGTAEYIVIKMDSSDIPYVAYRDNSVTQVKVKRFVSGAWTDVGAAVGSQTTLGGQVGLIDLELNSSDTPYVAYLDSGQSRKLTVKYFDGTNWITVGAAGFSSGGTSDISLALDNTSHPYVAYSGGGTNPNVMRFDGSNWVDVGSASLGTSGQKRSNSLVLDSLNNPYLAFKDTNSGNINVKRFNGSAWVDVGSAIGASGGVDRPVLALDASDRLYLAYQNGYLTQATMKRFDGANWVGVGIPAFAPSAGGISYYGFDMTLSRKGGPYVGYINSTTYKVAVWKYANTVTQAVTGTGSLSFAPLLVTIDVVDRGPGNCLNEITVQQFEQDHPQATTSNLQTGRYWSITQSGCAPGDAFTVTLSVPLGSVTQDALDKLCRWTGSAWDCGLQVDHTVTAYITRANIHAFSDWTVGYKTSPTVVTLQNLSATTTTSPVILGAMGVAMVSLAALGALAFGRRVKEKSRS